MEVQEEMEEVEVAGIAEFDVPVLCHDLNPMVQWSCDSGRNCGGKWST